MSNGSGTIVATSMRNIRLSEAETAFLRSSIPRSLPELRLKFDGAANRADRPIHLSDNEKEQLVRHLHRGLRADSWARVHGKGLWALQLELQFDLTSSSARGSVDGGVVFGSSSGGYVVLTAAEKKALLSLIPEPLVELRSTIETSTHTDVLTLTPHDKAQLYRHLDVASGHGDPGFRHGGGLSTLLLELRRDLELW